MISGTPSSRSGMARIVFRLSVMSSPASPSPASWRLAANLHFVAQAHCHTVHLRLHEPLERFAGQQFFHAADPLSQALELCRAHLLELLRVLCLAALFGEKIIQRQHRHTVADLLESGCGLAADALSRRIGCDQVRMRRLQFAQFAKQGVVIGIANRGSGVDVIASIVVFNCAPELGDFVFR